MSNKILKILSDYFSFVFRVWIFLLVFSYFTTSFLISGLSRLSEMWTLFQWRLSNLVSVCTWVSVYTLTQTHTYHTQNINIKKKYSLRTYKRIFWRTDDQLFYFQYRLCNYLVTYRDQTKINLMIGLVGLRATVGKLSFSLDKRHTV